MEFGYFDFGDAISSLLLDFLWQDYVIVLLRNGRRKEEARNELNVFLGDDSDSFVSWYFGPYAKVNLRSCYYKNYFFCQSF